MFLSACKSSFKSQTKATASSCGYVMSDDDEVVATLFYGDTKLKIIKGKNQEVEKSIIVLAKGNKEKALDFNTRRDGNSYILSSKEPALEIEISAFKIKKIKIFTKEITSVVPNTPFLKSVKYSGKQLDPEAMKIFADDWFEDGFDPSEWAKKGLKDGFEKVCSKPVNHSPTGLQGVWQSRAGICHALASATVGSIALQSSSVIKQGYQIPPSFVAMKAWQKNLAGTGSEAVSLRMKYIKDMKSDLIKLGKNTSSPADQKFIKDTVHKSVYLGQGGLAPTDIDLLKGSKAPITKSADIRRADYDEISSLTDELAALQEKYIKGNYSDEEMSKGLSLFFKKIDSYMGRYDELESIEIAKDSLKVKEVKFNYSQPEDQKSFWERLESGPIVGSYNNHSVSILGFDSNKSELIIYDSGLLSNNYSTYPIEEIFPRLKKYWTIH